MNTPQSIQQIYDRNTSAFCLISVDHREPWGKSFETLESRDRWLEREGYKPSEFIKGLPVEWTHHSDPTEKASCLNITPELLLELDYAGLCKLAEHLGVTDPRKIDVVGSVTLDDQGNIVGTVEAYAAQDQ